MCTVVNVYMCICMCICVYVYMCICVYVYMCICVYVYMRICVYVYMCICVYVDVDVDVYVYVYVYVHVHVDMYVCIDRASIGMDLGFFLGIRSWPVLESFARIPSPKPFGLTSSKISQDPPKIALSGRVPTGYKHKGCPKLKLPAAAPK